MEKLKNTISSIEAIDRQVIEKAQVRLDNLTKPQGSLGRLEDLAKQVAGITRKESPKIKDKVIFTLAADHGVAQESVSAFPQEVTAQMVYNFLRGGAAINVLAKHIAGRVVVVDMGVKANLENVIDKKVGLGTKDMAHGPAMTRQQAVKAIESGMEIFEDEFKKGIDIAGTGDMGIGNTTASSAIVACITQTEAESVTGRGTGLDDRRLAHKIEVIKKAIAVNRPNPQDPIEVLSKVGGFEIGGLAGIILASAAHKIPVVIDGFISGAAALLAYKIEPKVKDYIIAAHCSVERGHRIALNYLGLKPILDLDMRLGEGTGAALGMNIVEAAIKILTQMATFQDAGVSERADKCDEVIKTAKP